MMQRAARLAIYVVGLLFVLAAAWVFLTQTSARASAPGGIPLAILLLVVGIGIMASTQAMARRRARRDAIVHESVGPGGVIHNQGIRARHAHGSRRRRLD